MSVVLDAGHMGMGWTPPAADAVLPAAVGASGAGQSFRAATLAKLIGTNDLINYLLFGFVRHGRTCL